MGRQTTRALPWKVHKGFCASEVYDQDGNRVAADMTHEDAELLAAAPELLEAAERLMEHYSDGLPEHLIEEFQAAIANATGEKQ